MWLGASGTPNSAHNLPKIETLYSDIKLENLVLKKNRQKNKKTKKKNQNQNKKPKQKPKHIQNEMSRFQDQSKWFEWAGDLGATHAPRTDQFKSVGFAGKNGGAWVARNADFSGILWNFLEVSAQVSDEFRAGLRRVTRSSPAHPDLRLSRFLWTLAAWHWPQW